MGIYTGMNDKVAVMSEYIQKLEISMKKYENINYEENEKIVKGKM